MSRPNAQSMKPATAAKKLDVYLPATPAEFQENAITRAELAALQADPPQWLKDLRKNGPHPKNLVAAKLGVWFWWPLRVRPRPASQMLQPYGSRAAVRQLLLWEDGDPIAGSQRRS